MKNKKKTYLLLAIVLIVWALLIYRFFSLTGESSEVIEPLDGKIEKPVAVKKRDTFSINVNYRDPFLGKNYLAGKAVKTAKRKPKNTGPIVWPAVIYKGIVSDTKNKKKVFMLIIEGKTYMMREKETEQGVTLKKGDRQAIDVRFKGEGFSIQIQE